MILSRGAEANERDVENCCREIGSLDGERRLGIDLLGGPEVIRTVGATRYARRTVMASK